MRIRIQYQSDGWTLTAQTPEMPADEYQAAKDDITEQGPRAALLMLYMSDMVRGRNGAAVTGAWAQEAQDADWMPLLPGDTLPAKAPQLNAPRALKIICSYIDTDGLTLKICRRTTRDPGWAAAIYAGLNADDEMTRRSWAEWYLSAAAGVDPDEAKRLHIINIRCYPLHN